MKKLLPFEIQHQELLKELVHTERTHRKKLLIMKYVRLEEWVESVGGIKIMMF